MEGSGWSWHRGKSRDTCRACVRKICCCSKSWKWGQWSMAHQLWGVVGSLLWLQKEQGPFGSALHEALACLLAVQFWFCTAHCAQFCIVTNGHISQGPRVVYRSSLSHRHASQAVLPFFHAATVTRSQNTWVIYSLLAAQSQAWCFPNNTTPTPPCRTYDPKLERSSWNRGKGYQIQAKCSRQLAAITLFKYFCYCCHDTASFRSPIAVISHHHSVQPSTCWKSQLKLSIQLRQCFYFSSR